MFKAFKKNFLAGFLLTIPVVLTYMAASYVVRKLDQLMAPIITSFTYWLEIPVEDDFNIPGLGFVISLILVFLLGLFAKNFFGKKIVARGQNILNRTPLVRGIYVTFKQVFDSIANEEEKTFEKVAIVRYPHLSIQVLGIVACDAKGELLNHMSDEDPVNVFVPMIPNVTLGWYILVPRNELQLLDMSVEEGMKMIISFGMVSAKSKTTVSSV